MSLRQRVVVVSGLSGSGKSTAIHALEDLGYYCIDNLPPALIPRFIELCEGSGEIERVALGVDSRSREFLDQVPRALAEVRQRGHAIEMLYLDAADGALIRRFSETRRPHPMSDGSDIAAGIQRERERLAALRDQADRIVDTSAFTGHQLREQIRMLFAGDARSGGFQVALVSFGFKHGLPSDADLVWDVRFLPNPFYVEDLRPQTGLDGPVATYVLESPLARRFCDLAVEYLRFSIPGYEREGKRYLTVCIGCTGGRHRSVVLVEELGRMLKQVQVEVSLRHRDVKR